MMMTRVKLCNRYLDSRQGTSAPAIILPGYTSSPGGGFACRTNHSSKEIFEEKHNPRSEEDEKKA